MMQKKLAHLIVKNTTAKKPLNKKELALNSGYSPIHAETATKVIFEAKGVIKELNTLGFTSEAAKSVVSEILNDKSVEPSDRLNAADKVFKVHGDYAPEKRLNVTVDTQQLTEIVNAQIAMLRQLNKG